MLQGTQPQGTGPASRPEPVADAAPVARGWAERYALGLAVTDALVIAWAVLGAQLTRFGLSSDDEATISRGYDITLNYLMLSALLIAAWLVFLVIFRTRDRRIVGAGSIEYRRIWEATFWLFGLVAIVAFLFKAELARGFILLAFPLGLVVLILSRWIWRQWLSSRRAHGSYADRVLLLGSRESVATVAGELGRVPSAGYRVVGAVVPGARKGVLAGTEIPLSGDAGRVVDRMAELAADTLIVTSSDELPPQRIRELSWELDPGRQHLVMAPTLTDIGGPRIQMRPVAGLPLVHVETPRYEGSKAFAKRSFDLLGSVLLLLVLCPLLLVIALVVRLSTPGPVLFRQERIGYQGRPFRMLKFRTMVANAEEQLVGLLDAQRDAGNDVLFKLKDDPRITPVGRFLRRFSLDELPQLLNVAAGQMSLVGPRPPLEREVATYEAHVHRKFLVKPGITGLWQVSGRSELSWEDSVRLDLYYVENWSITGDLVILWRTLRAVLSRRGAY